MGTVPMLCPYKMMFSGLIPYLGEERRGRGRGEGRGEGRGHISTQAQVSLPGDAAQGVTLL